MEEKTIVSKQTAVKESLEQKQQSESKNDNPETVLEKIVAQMKAKEKEKSVLETSIGGYKKVIAELTKVVTEIVQGVDNYKKRVVDFQKDIEIINVYYQKKKEMIDAVLKDKDAILKIIGGYDDGVENLKKRLNDLKGQLGQTNAEHEALMSVALSKETAYNNMKSLGNTIESNLKNLKQLRDSIEKEDDTINARTVFFLVFEMERILLETKKEVRSEDALKSECNVAWKQLEKARIDLDNKKEEREEIKAQLNQKQKELELLQKNRREEILKRIRLMSPVE